MINKKQVIIIMASATQGPPGFPAVGFSYFSRGGPGELGMQCFVRIFGECAPGIPEPSTPDLALAMLIEDSATPLHGRVAATPPPEQQLLSIFPPLQMTTLPQAVQTPPPTQRTPTPLPRSSPFEEESPTPLSPNAQRENLPPRRSPSSWRGRGRPVRGRPRGWHPRPPLHHPVQK